MKKRKLDDFEPEDDHSALSSSNSESENEQDPANQLTSRLSIGYDLKTLPRLRHHDRIFILKDVDLKPNNNKTNPIFFSLIHPRHSKKENRYMICSRKILEIQACKGEASSWFIDESVSKDGYLYIATPVDPLFLLLPRLMELRKKTDENDGVFVQIEQIVQDPSCKGFEYFCDEFLDNVDVSIICDMKQTPTVTAIRLNDAKVLDWLKAKVISAHDALASSSKLKKLAQPDSVDAVAPTFRQTSEDVEAKDKRDFVTSAVALISEYINKSLSDQLADLFGVARRQAKNPLMMGSSTSNKKSAVNGGVSSIIEQVRKEQAAKAKATAKAKAKPMSRGQAQLAKVDKRGMKKMTSFFQVKKKTKTE